MTAPDRRVAYDEALDRRNAAVHEGGHIIAARYARRDDLPFGKIWRDLDPPAEWVGHSLIMAKTLSLRDQRLIGVAGAVAEIIWEGRGAPVLDNIHERLSDSDRELINSAGDIIMKFDLNTSPHHEVRAWRNATTRAYKLFNRHTGKLWPALCREAHRLIVASRVDAIMAELE